MKMKTEKIFTTNSQSLMHENIFLMHVEVFTQINCCAEKHILAILLIMDYQCIRSEFLKLFYSRNTLSYYFCLRNFTNRTKNCLRSRTKTKFVVKSRCSLKKKRFSLRISLIFLDFRPKILVPRQVRLSVEHFT